MATKDPAAVALGKKRWRNTTKEELAEMAVGLHKARQAALTPEERKAIAQKAAAARWGEKEKAAVKKAPAKRARKRTES